MAAVTVKELKEILATTEAPRKLVDPVTELPLWDETLMAKIRNAKSKEELAPLEPQVKESMVINYYQLLISPCRSFCILI